ncbi:hypothetical protein GCK72_022401 [Caenorhabditis remanei]|uniref:Uncharacterized protein n=1 Tax=Caenorhabditis remanei TaxID=31234 RepID=A0A6A5FTS6_CAERE|nr:hypothetical protein GCK72_022401 [Caenorhabditis remanei]KAF1745953.1 hypothetical protein GCK72_022401 [Caenorhabditis remanei]
MFTMERLEENMRNPNLQEQFVLDEIRFGKISTITEKFLKRNCTMFDTSTGGLLSQIEQLRETYPEKEFALLAATRAKVDALNSWKICLMPGAYKYWAVNRKPVSGNTEGYKFVEHSFPHPLFLAPGCRVIITRNMRRDHSVTNGTLGILKAARSREGTFIYIESPTETIRRCGGNFPWRQQKPRLFTSCKGKRLMGLF